MPDWNHSQATLFEAHAWMNQDSKESTVIISDDLNHTKHTVCIFMSFLYNHLTSSTFNTINTYWSCIPVQAVPSQKNKPSLTKFKPRNVEISCFLVILTEIQPNIFLSEFLKK